MENVFVSAVVVAAGSATRMGGEKQRLLLGGLPVLARTLRVLQHTPCVNEIVLVARAQDQAEFAAYRERYALSKLAAVVVGGDTRQQSVQCGVRAISPQTTLLAIHDGARPLVTAEDVTRIVEAAAACGGATAATPVKDTIKVSQDGETIAQTPDRACLWAVQTPQVFDKARYLSAVQHAQEQGLDCTDDCRLFELAGFTVRLVPTGYQNIKITTPEDLVTARGLLGERSAVRIGHGYDVHRLVAGRRLILGGVEIPFDKGLLGHSDADVLTHAVMDALLGAAALGDIGKWFPDTEERWRGADSMALLCEVTTLLRDRGFVPCNIDATVLAEAPKLRPHIDEMRRRLAAACGLPVEAVSVKATTEEKMGFTGSGDGMAAHAVCLVETQ